MSWKPPWVNIDDVSLSLSPGIHLHNRNPNDGQLGVPGGGVFEFSITSSLMSLINLPATVITVNGVVAYNGGFTPEFSGPLSSVVAAPWGGWSVDFVVDGVEDYASESVVTIRVQSQDALANALDETYSFTIKDTTAPRVLKALAIDRNVVQVEFTDNVVGVEATAVSVDFPWGLENLTWDGENWVFNPLTYPYVSTGLVAPFNLAKDTLLTVVVNGNERTVAIPSNQTTAAGVASALNAVLNIYGATAWDFGGRVWLRSDTPTGSIEVKEGGAYGALKFELGSQGPRVAYYTTPGTYTLPVHITGVNGVVSEVTVEYTLEGLQFVLQNFIESFGDSVLEASHYVLSIDGDRVQADYNPTYITTVETVERLNATTVLLYLTKAMTQGGYYYLTVTGVEDSEGNVVDPDNNKVEFTGFTPTEMNERDWDIYELFPVFNRRRDADTLYQFKKFCSALTEVSSQWLSDIDYVFRWQDIAQAPERIVDGMLANLGNPFGCISLDATTKKRLIGFLTTLYKEKGTEKGIKNAIRFFLGIDPITFKYYWGTGWVLGKPGRGELAVTTVLNSGSLRDRYSFSIITTKTLTDEEREGIECIVRIMKPAHTHFISIIEPVPPFVPDHWMIPWSGFGSTTILH